MAEFPGTQQKNRRLHAAAGVLAGHMQTLADYSLSERNPDGVEQAAWSMRLIAREALEQWRKGERDGV